MSEAAIVRAIGLMVVLIGLGVAAYAVASPYLGRSGGIATGLLVVGLGMLVDAQRGHTMSKRTEADVDPS